MNWFYFAVPVGHNLTGSLPALGAGKKDELVKKDEFISGSGVEVAVARRRAPKEDLGRGKGGGGS